jgi:hypothetical protein
VCFGDVVSGAKLEQTEGLFSFFAATARRIGRFCVMGGYENLLRC